MLSEEDLATRLGRITASTVAAFLGFHWYSSPSQQWDYHTGRVPFPESVDTRLGELLEPGLVRYAVEKLGWTKYLYPCGTRVSQELPWAAATPDCMTIAENLGIQAKNQNYHMAKGYLGSPQSHGASDNALVPAYMLAQCQWEMLVTGAVRWYLCTYFGGRDFRIYQIWRDQSLIDRLVPKAYVFWQDHIDPEGPQSRPSDEGWNQNVGRRKPRRLRGDELIAAPIPRPT